MKKINIISLMSLMLLLAGCTVESPFSSEESKKSQLCEFHKSALNLDVKSDDNITKTKSEATTDVDIDDFCMTFKKDGKTVKSMRYGDMPDIVMLEEGTYQVSAEYGENKVAAWENPVFSGISGEFEVSPGLITTSIDPIKCTLQNVKVSIVFDPQLAAAVDDDAYIEVKLGSAESLKFTKNETRTGYFKIDEEKTLVATFNGKINGSQVSETKNLDKISNGYHYQITFKLHTYNNGSQGGANGSVNVDASVDYENIENEVTVKNKLLVDQSERPKQDDEEGDDNTGDDNTEEELSIIALSPLTLDDENLIYADEFGEDPGMKKAVLRIHSSSGIEKFDVEIISDKLTPEELAVVGLSSKFSLVTGKSVDGVDLSGPLTGLGFPCGENVIGKNDIEFSLTKFMPLLAPLGSNEKHIFKLSVSDAKGSTVEKSLIIKIK